MGTIYDIKAIIYVLSTIILVGINIYTITRQRKKDREKHEEKFATKSEVKNQINMMDNRVTEVERDLETNRKENLIAHKDLKNEIINHIDVRFNAVDKRFEDIKELIKKMDR